jgi:hypothetical protein
MCKGVTHGSKMPCPQKPDSGNGRGLPKGEK